MTQYARRTRVLNSTFLGAARTSPNLNCSACQRSGGCQSLSHKSTTAGSARGLFPGGPSPGESTLVRWRFVLGLLRSPGCATAGSTADGELPAALAADGAAADGAAADGAAA